MNYRLIKQYPGSPPLGEEWDENTEVKTLTSNTLEEYQSTGIKIKDLPEYWQPVEFTLPEKWYIDIKKRPIPKEIVDFFNKGNKTDTYLNIHKSFIAFKFHNKFDGSHLVEYKFDLKDYTEITFEQFKKYVLKENEEIIVTKSHSDQLNLKDKGIDSIVISTEEVVKDYEILSFKNPDNNLIYTKYNNSYYVTACGHTHVYKCLNYYQIHSIKRLSDDEIFTIGDNVDGLGIHDKNLKLMYMKIKGDNSDIMFFNNGVYFQNLSEAEKSKQPLFTTEDGVDIFEGDEHYAVNIINFDLIKTKRNTLPKDNDKRFSTKEKAEEYILMNKPCLSINDIIMKNQVSYPSNETLVGITFSKLKNLVKTKLNNKN